LILTAPGRRSLDWGNGESIGNENGENARVNDDAKAHDFSMIQVRQDGLHD